VPPQAAAERRAHARLPDGPVADAARGNSSAAAILSYDVPHRAPWDYRVSLYTFTKSIAAGAFLVPLMLVLMGDLTFESRLWTWTMPLLAGAFLALTGLILIWDLEHPKRFLYVLLKPQPRSWLVRGGFIITGYGGVLGLLFLGNFVELSSVSWWLAVLGTPLAAMTAIYTAFLFAQAKARDLWQSPLLPPHLLVQAIIAGAGVLVLVGGPAAADVTTPLAWIFVGANAVHLLMVLGEVTLTHGTAHAHLALRNMVRGQYASFFWISVVLGIVALAAGSFPTGGAIAGLIGLLAYEHAYVQAGQSVPLA
jgi:formate-dependent nitrite reductase membrane component NrfD